MFEDWVRADCTGRFQFPPYRSGDCGQADGHGQVSKPYQKIAVKIAAPTKNPKEHKAD